MSENPFKNKQEKLDIEIELAKPEDLEAYRTIWMDALEKNPEAFQSRLEVTRKKVEADWKTDLENSKRILVFAKAGSSQECIKSIASAVDQSAGVWLISRVYTRPEFRRQGLSEKVLKRVLEEVKKRGGVKAKLTVRNGPNQEAARYVYREKLGFKDITPWDNTIENSFFLEKNLDDEERK